MKKDNLIALNLSGWQKADIFISFLIWSI